MVVKKLSNAYSDCPVHSLMMIHIQQNQNVQSKRHAPFDKRYKLHLRFLLYVSQIQPIPENLKIQKFNDSIYIYHIH